MLDEEVHYAGMRVLVVRARPWSHVVGLVDMEPRYDTNAELGQKLLQRVRIARDIALDEGLMTVRDHAQVWPCFRVANFRDQRTTFGEEPGDLQLPER